MKTFELRNVASSKTLKVSLVLSSQNVHFIHIDPVERDGKAVDDLEPGESGRYHVSAGKGSFHGEYTVVRTV